MVTSQLRTTVVVMPCIDRIDSIQLCFFFQLTGQSFCHAVHTSHSGDNPYFVSDSYLTVLADIAIERTVVG